jgi:hypothetical protein
MYELIIDKEVCNVECTNVNWNPECQPFGRAGIDFVEGGKVTKTPIYTTPPAQPAPVQECLVHGECFGGKCIYTTPPAAQPAVPDAIIEAGESPEFRDGWNECRETMLQMLKARKA